MGLGALNFSESKNQCFQFWRKKSKWENLWLWVLQQHQRTSSFGERTSKKTLAVWKAGFWIFQKTWKLRLYTETNFLNFHPPWISEYIQMGDSDTCTTLGFFSPLQTWHRIKIIVKDQQISNYRIRELLVLYISETSKNWQFSWKL